jgi:hypothetical protein
MVNAMKGSMISGQLGIIEKAPNNKAMLCAKVNTRLCFIIDFRVGLKKNKLIINKIWSTPPGNTCVMPIVMYL